jgi:hypothetical protein
MLKLRAQMIRTNIYLWDKDLSTWDDYDDVILTLKMVVQRKRNLKLSYGYKKNWNRDAKKAVEL